MKHFEFRAKHEEPPADVLREALATWTAPLASSRYTLTSSTDVAVTYHRKYRPWWVIVAAILFFPIGLLFLLYTRHATIAWVAEPVGDKTLLTVNGEGPKRIRKAFERNPSYRAAPPPARGGDAGVMSFGFGLRGLAAATAIVCAVAFSLVFFWVPLDTDQGFVQKIFYLHVPLAIVALLGFVVGGVFAILHLRSGDRRWDAYSYVSIHMSVIFGVAVLITGAIWAKASWGHWWVWDEPTLVSFLIVFLMYATYYPFRYAIEDRDRQARYASVFAVTAGAFVPLNFMAVRMAESLVHPRTFATAEGGLPGEMMLTFLVSLLAMGLLWVTMVKFELTAKSARGQLKRLRRALDAPAPGGSSRVAPEVS